MISVLDWLTKLTQNHAQQKLVDLLTAGGAARPELKPVADQWIADLGGAATPDNLAAVAAAIPSELLNIFHGKVDPRDHPSDGI